MEVLLGLGLEVVGTLASACGALLAHRAEADPRLLAAATVLIAGVSSACELLAMEFAPLVVLAPLGSLTVVWSVLLGTRRAARAVRQRELRAAAAVCFGCLVCTTALVLGKSRRLPEEPHTRRVFYATVLGSALTFILIRSSGSARPAWRGFAPGCVAAFTQTCAKAAEAHLALGRDFAAAVFACCALVFGFAQLSLLLGAYADFPPHRVNPAYFGALVVCTAFVGASAFAELQGLSAAALAAAAAGVVLVVLGVALP
jgi:hypothetical protein